MDILVAANLKFAIDHNRKTTRMRTGTKMESVFYFKAAIIFRG